MSANPMTGPTFVVPISNGIFGHCSKIGVALWTFLWLIDRTTKEIPGTGGHSEGLVYGGRPINARDIANDLGIATRTVHEHLDRLVKGGYLRRSAAGKGLPASYVVLRSKKWSRFGPQNLDIIELGDLEEGETSRKSANLPRGNTVGVRGNPRYPRGNPLPIKETRQDKTQLNIVEEKSFDGNLLLVSPPLKVEKDLDRRVKEGWDYFLEKTKKSPSQYQLTRDRERMGLNAFQALIAFARRREHPDPWSAAPDLFRMAVDRLASSPFHNGDNQHHRKYLDWHQLFKGKEYPAPRKLVEFWLDDERWPA